MGKHWKSIMIKWITCFAFHHGAKPFLKLHFFLFNFIKYHQNLKAENNNIALKRSDKIEMSFWCLQFFQKPKTSIFCPRLLKQKFFIRFWEELKTQKSTFEINWPLVNACIHSMINVVWILNIITEVISKFRIISFYDVPNKFFFLLFGSNVHKNQNAISQN